MTARAAPRATTEARHELIRRAAECAAVGFVWFVFSLPLVTAGGAWAAAASIFQAWNRGEEPPLLRTFARQVRAQFLPGLLTELCVVAVVAIAYFDVRVATASRMPGFVVEAVAVVAIAAIALGVLLLSFAHRAATGSAWTESLRDTVLLCRTRPWAPLVVVFAVAVSAALILVLPAFVAIMAGPTCFAACAVYTRASHP
jgi:uncharacterized membrane protein YesL